AVLITRPNFLILDEPTNDLDIMTLGILEEYLKDFKGCVIVISHDRFFLDSIVDHLFVMEGNGVIKDFPGNHTDYRNYLKELRAAKQKEVAEKPEAPKRETRERARKMTFKERKEYEALTVEIEKLTQEKDTLESLFNSGENISDVAEKAARYSQLKELLDEKEMRWLELDELN
ncbi:MAG: ABC transporter ATP-binding protein, partial [Duncaniella sp.]|nr:ABC transporter ATP-binding protein [Duncaniella sp.]